MQWVFPHNLYLIIWVYLILSYTIKREYNLPTMSSAWKDRFAHEIRSARAARQQGNEGQARVCARRAAGAAIRAYLDAKGYFAPPASAYELCRLLLDCPDVQSEVRAIAARLLLRVNEEHDLPPGVDLIEDAFRLTSLLGLDPEIDPNALGLR
jgi:HEAT repeat protein